VYAESVKSCVVSINDSRPAMRRDSVFEFTNVTRTTSTMSYAQTDRLTDGVGLSSRWLNGLVARDVKS